MYQFLISLGFLGLIVSTIVFFAQWSDGKPVFYIALTWGAFFGIAVYGLHLMEIYPIKKEPIQTTQSLALNEYNRCLNFYDNDYIIKTMKITASGIGYSFNKKFC